MSLKKRVASSVTLASLALAGCSGSSSSSSSSATQSNLSGVAATGAPIVSGKVEIKGANGAVVETTTNSSGEYGSSVSNLTSPYLIRVTSPTGEKLISVASADDVASKKNINVTPITHLIVANVFKQKSADTLFEDFTTKSSDFTPAKLVDAKDDFRKNLVSAGVIGGSGILTDSSVDLMNASFKAGSGSGLDKLLDALDIDIEKGATNIEVKLKDGTSIYTDEVTTNNETVTDKSSAISAVTTQLDALAEIKKFFSDASETFNSFVTNCKGAAVDDGSACDKDTLHSTMLNLMHTDYKWSGLNKATDAWAMFCYQDADGEEDATEKSNCNYIRGERVTFSDISILKYDNVKDEAVVQSNSYTNGEFSDTEVEILKKEGGNWKLYGNQNSRPFWFEGLALHKTTKPRSGSATDSYAAQIQLWVGGNAASIGTDIKLKAINKDGTTNTNLNTALGGDSATGLTLESDTTLSLYVPSKKYVDYSNNTLTSTTCGTCYFNHDSNKIDLSTSALAEMDSIQAFELSYNDGSLKTEIVRIRRPIKITSSTAASLVPQFKTTNLCTSVPVSNVYSFSIPTGQTGDWVSIYLSGQVSSTWYSADKSVSARNQTSVTLTNTNNITTPEYANFYLKSVDDFGRKFLRIIECQ